jgi:adenylate kinase family enzyme
MADSLLLPVVTRVASKATDELVQSVTRMWGIDTDRGKLERLLLAVQCMLPDAKVKGETSCTSPVVRRWMKELKAVAYQADDVLDDLQYEALRRDREANEGEPTARKVSRYLTLHSPLLFRLTVSRNLSKVLKKLDDLVLEMHTLALVERPVAQHALCQQTQVVLDGSGEIFGRDDDKEVVVNLLLDHQHQKNVQVLPIIGMEGVGKTTLAKMVYNDHRIQKHFSLKIWHCVSKNFEATSVVRSVIELATGERCDLPDNSKFWRARLQGAIGRKRFLLILDNVRNEEQEKWEDELKPLLCTSIGGSGTMIVVTSRSQQVAAIMGTLPVTEPSKL